MLLKTAFVGSSLLALACSSAQGQAAFPNKAITIIVPTAAGGANDVMARLVGQGMAGLLKGTVIVENKAGANGALAAEFVARAAPDGHTIMLGYTATHGMNPALQKLRYDPLKDFEPIGMIAESATLMVASPSVKAGSAKELVPLLKATPDKYSYASAGIGTAPHFAAEMFKLSTGTSPIHVPYKGSAPAVNDLLGGQTQFMFPSLFTALPFVNTGKLKPLAVAGPKRSPLLPQVTTLAEQGIANVDVSQWYALFAPAKTPKPVIEQLNRALNATLADKQVIKKLEEHGGEVETSTPEQLRTRVEQELVKWRRVVQQAKITAD
jgi:tripartite-type tricarboxylate transporter receptor subunit TctC